MSPSPTAISASPVTVTVGVEPAAGVDVVGGDGRTIQIAVDTVASRGGGVVRVRRGQYRLQDSVRLRPGVQLIGDGPGTLLSRGPLLWSDLAVDADIGQDEITPVNDGKAWQAGMGVCLWDQRSGWALGSRPARVVGVAGGVLQLDDLLTDERCAAQGGRVVNYFPMLLAERAPNVRIEGFDIDAGVDDPHGVLQGLWIGEVHVWRSPHAVLRRLKAINGQGDGIVLANASTDCLVEDCETAHNSFYGIHPGSHSARAIVRRCRIHHNGSDGLYICWGIRQGQFLDNDIHDNGHRLYRSGISIGHKDTDCLIANNRIRDNRKYGVCFRQKTEANGAHRAVLRENLIENNGSAPDELADVKRRLEGWEAVGCGVHISGVTKDVLLERNTIRETRPKQPWQQHAVMLRPGVSGLRMLDNHFSGHPGAAIVDESGAANLLQD